MSKTIRTAFAILPNVHLIDLAGPVQVFFEANQFGANFTLLFCALKDNETVFSKQGLYFSQLPSYKTLTLEKDDYLFIAGIEFSEIKKGQLKNGYDDFFNWIKIQSDKGVNICSVCSGTFILADSEMLNKKNCTTHWKCIEYLKENYSSAKTVDDQLFVKDSNIYTSAGMTSGIDMALFIVEENYGPIVTSKVAREMVVYLRRSGGQSQGSIYLDFRTHIHPGIHAVQDYIIQNPTLKNSIEELSQIARMSERNLTRLFKKHTGISIQDFKTKCRLAHAESLLNHPGYTIDYIALECGFKDGRQLRRIWKQYHRKSPSAYKAQKKQ